MATDGDTPSPTSSTTTLQDVAEVDSVEPAGPTVSTKAHDLIHPLPPLKTVPDDQAVAGFPSSPRRHVRFMSAAALHHSSDMNPILAKLERKSRLCAQSLRCATCGRRGAGFPKCPRCGDSWCSRECRLFGGKRHACAKK
ncbi:hypothetical protein FISHEDRAFT_61000 [Fistulina hepatica ATCC 64428]|uniref:HIT-type domain-containing protein n=1 Tax=Fistulina hepatica ATCC 64428 TaxID=1128425 RepID=A0A0D7A3I4_9AGAR|nr:hypothetical protein FISHEDRAFT_61000 [Fistulina hepatica ATCC 64428]